MVVAWRLEVLGEICGKLDRRGVLALTFCCLACRTLIQQVRAVEATATKPEQPETTRDQSRATASMPSSRATTSMPSSRATASGEHYSRATAGGATVSLNCIFYSCKQ